MTAIKKVFATILGGLAAVGRFARKATGPVGRFVGKKPLHAVVALGVVVVGLAVAVGLLWASDQGHQDEVDAREDAVAAARENVPKVLSYDFETVDRQLEEIGGLIGDPFKKEYTDFFTQSVVPTAKSQQIKTNTVVAAESVIDGDDKEVKTLLFLNQETRSNAGPDPVLTGSRIRVTMEKDGGDWVITGLEPV